MEKRNPFDSLVRERDFSGLGPIIRVHFARAGVQFHNKRSTVEQWIMEGKLAVSRTNLSCHRFRGNEVRLRLSLIT